MSLFSKQFKIIISLILLVIASPSLSANNSAGEKIFIKCKACHSTRLGTNKLGPSLHGVFNRKAGKAQGYRYSKALAGSNIVWNENNLDKFLANPRNFIKGNRMSFVGLRKKQDRTAMIDYLKSLK